MADQGSQSALQTDINAKCTTNGANENTGLRIRTLFSNIIDTIYAQLGRDRHPTVTFSTNTNTAQDPGQATIRFNSGTIASVTEVALSDVDSQGIDKGDLNSQCAGILQLRTVSSAATVEFLVTGIVHTSWSRYTVTYLNGSLPANGTALTYRFLPSDTATPAVTTAITGLQDTDTLILGEALQKSVAGQFGDLSEKTDPVGDDRLVLEDSEDSNNKKGVRAKNIRLNVTTTINDEAVTLLDTHQLIRAIGIDPTTVNDTGNMNRGFCVELVNDSTNVMTFNPDSGSAIVVPAGGRAILRHRSGGSWMDLLSGKADIYLDGVNRSVHATFTGTTSSGGQMSPIDFTSANGNCPALSDVHFISGSGDDAANVPVVGYVIDTTLSAYVVKFFNVLDLAPAEDGTPVSFTVTGTKA